MFLAVLCWESYAEPYFVESYVLSCVMCGATLSAVYYGLSCVPLCCAGFVGSYVLSCDV